jgi:ferredoxin-NADP reductase
MSTPRKIHCLVETVEDHGEGVYSILLRPEKRLPPFKAGQFLHLTVDEFDPASFWPESRVFSIASSPSDRDCLRICYSVKGKYTRKMAETLKEGSSLWVKLPYGDFIIDSTQDVVLVAGGTGISAFIAFLEKLPQNHERRVSLVYGVREPRLMLFEEIILRLAREMPWFSLFLFVESNHDCLSLDPAISTEKAILPCSGRISLEKVLEKLPSPESQVFYLSGPPEMLKCLGNDLSSRGVPQDSIRTDAWE